MIRQSEPFQLKKSIVIVLLSYCFILASPANLAYALFQGGVHGWYWPSMWLALFQKLPVSQMMALTLLPVAGFCLFIQRKTSWFFATMVLGLICAQNLYGYFTNADSIFPLAMQLVINGCVFVIIYFFRYPYLHRRDKLFRGLSIRYIMDMPMKVEGVDGHVQLVSLSNTGCLLQFQNGQKLPPIGSVIRFAVKDKWSEGEVMRYENGGCGIRFSERLKFSKKKLLKINALLGKNQSEPESA